MEDAVRFWCILRPRDVVGWCADGREESGHLRFFFFSIPVSVGEARERDRQTARPCGLSSSLPSFLRLVYE